jgi:transcriptional antiterminator RfaH
MDLLTNNFKKGWYLIYTRPRHEKKVVAQLEERRIVSYLPTTKNFRQWHDRKKEIEAPLFPSYVFVYVNSMTEYYLALEPDSVLQYVRFGRQVAVVRDSVVKGIQILATTCAAVEVQDHSLLPGIHTTINFGPLAGLECEVVEVKGRQRIVVRVSLLQREVLVDLPPIYLGIAQSSAVLSS